MSVVETGLITEKPILQKPDIGGGANLSRVRQYNERLVLSLVRRYDSLPKSEISKKSGLSAQTVSVIMRALEQDALLLRGLPNRGKVGQPSIPMSLNPDGVFSVGLKIGRRSADLLLMDFTGNIRKQLHLPYLYPLPETILKFTESGVAELVDSLPLKYQDRVAGVGVSQPFELWNWADQIDSPAEQMQQWKNFDLPAILAEQLALPVFIQNDGSAACGAELVFGLGSDFSDYVYFFIGTFVGGGVVLNNSVYSGRTGNAGALGSMPVGDQQNKARQLIDHASLIQLERQLIAEDVGYTQTVLEQKNWDNLGDTLDQWIEETGRHFAIAITSSCSVIDFEAVIIDGGMPEAIKNRIVEVTKRELILLDLDGISMPSIHAGLIGKNAREIGAASLPLFNRYLLDHTVLLKQMVM